MTFCALSSAKGMNIKMKIGFNEATALECKGQSLIADLEACEKYGFIILKSVLTVLRII